MYQTIGLGAALKTFAFVCVAIIIGWVTLFPPTDYAAATSWWAVARSLIAVAVKTISFVGAVVVFAGRSKVFEYLCRLPGVSNVFPPISGKWTVTLESNWAQIQPRAETSATTTTTPARTTVSAKATIIARLFFVRINLESSDSYSTSETLSVRALKDDQDGTVSLHYIYRNTTANPRQTDSDAHFGAACVKVKGRGQNMLLDGVYWTNRNWHKGLNTAGTVKFVRA